MREGTSPKVLIAIFLIVSCCAVFNSSPALALDYPFCDDFEGGAGNWTLDAPWGLTTEAYYSATHSLTDSPGNGYGSSVNISATLAEGVNLGLAQMPMLSFWHTHVLEEDEDWAYVEVSTDAGAHWTMLFTATDQQPSWEQEKIDLSSYAGFPNVRIRFVNWDSYDDWYIDDIRIAGTELTRINLLFPPNQATLFSSPTFAWAPNGGENNAFAVDFALSLDSGTLSLGDPIYSTYETWHIPITETSWPMPDWIWNMIPSGRTVYWRVRGADLNDPPINIITSDETWSFYKE